MAYPRFEIVSYDSLINILFIISHLLTNHFIRCVYQISSINDNHSDGPLISDLRFGPLNQAPHGDHVVLVSPLGAGAPHSNLRCLVFGW